MLDILFTYKLVHHGSKEKCCQIYLDRNVYPSKWLSDVFGNGIDIETVLNSVKTTNQILLSDGNKNIKNLD